jgi:uncharacterized integral membrane protein (TIGR00698 family)
MKDSKLLANIIFIIFSFIIILFTDAIIAALVLGILFATFFKDKANSISKKISSYPLQIGIVFLGLTIGLDTLTPIIHDYFIWISLFVIFSFLICYAFSRLFGLDTNLALLLSSGSAICGATAMAVVAPLIKAKPQTLLISLAIIFILNTIAIILFPIFGSYLNMSAYQFGVFSALAIHDTGSVIGSALQFDSNSVEVAASLKVMRTLWLIPLVIVLNYQFNTNKVKNVFPLFIVFFVLAILISNVINISYETILYINTLSKTFIAYGIFIIGLQSSNLDLSSIKTKPLMAAVTVWIVLIPVAYFIATI